MANKKITELNAATSLAATDVVPVVDVSADETKKITTTNLFRTLPDGTAAAPSLSFASDAGNGVFLAGTDTVGISTGGTQRVTVDGSGNVTISGGLTVEGQTTTVESTIVTIDDKNIELGSVASPSNTTADGGGITLKGATDKTIKWINSTGFWTFNTGVEIDGNLQMDDGKKIRLGTGQDLQVYHNGSNSEILNNTGDLFIKNNTNDADVLLQTDNGSGGTSTYVLCDGSTGNVRLYHYGTEKFKTKSDGIDVTGEVQCDSLDVDGTVDIDGGQINYNAGANFLRFTDNCKATFGASDDLQILHDSIHSYIKDAGAGELRILGNVCKFNNAANSATLLRATESGSVDLFYNGAQKFATKSDGVDITGEVQCDSLDVDGNVDITGTVNFHNAVGLQDNDKLLFGASGDLEIYHDGNNSFIKDTGTGRLTISTSQLQLTNAADSEVMIRADQDGEVNLYHNGVGKLATKSTGIDVTGQVESDGILSVTGTAGFSTFVHAAGQGGVRLTGTGASSSANLVFSNNYNNTITDEYTIQMDGGSDALLFKNGGTGAGTVMELDSSGRLLLGTSTEGNTAADDLTIATSGHTGITIRSGTSHEGAVYFSDGTSGNSEYRGYLQYKHNEDSFLIGTAALERLRINSNGAWAIEGASNYGTSGQVLTSNGNDAPTWQDAGQASIGGANAIGMNDNVKINFGGGNDLQIYHSGSHSYIKDAGAGNLYIASNRIELRNSGDNESLANFIENGACEFYYDNGKRLETATNGVSVTGNVDLSGELNMMGSSDGAKYLDVRLGSNTFNIRGTSGGDANHETLATFTRNGPVKLFYDNSQKFQTKTDGIDVTGEVQCDSLDVDGASNFSGVPVFQSNVGIGNTTVGNSFANGKALALGDNDTGIRQNGDGILEVWSNNAQMFRFRNGGNSNQSYNHLNPSSNNSKDLGTSSLRWRNVYTNDLNLSNEGSANDVDGTWGNYTIQEGEDDLFLINRRNGKKYKFNLTEVS